MLSRVFLTRWLFGTSLLLPSALSNSSEMLAADGTGLGAEKDNTHFIGWVFRDAAREAGILAESYESACVFMHVTAAGKKFTNEQRQWHECPVRSPLWNDGTNHVMVDFGDDGR